MRKQNKKNCLLSLVEKRREENYLFLCARRDQVYKTYIYRKMDRKRERERIEGKKEFSSKPVLSATD